VASGAARSANPSPDQRKRPPVSRHGGRLTGRRAARLFV
jgi:hypothetical protein